MKEFDQLIQTIDHLLGPQGCPWDQKQTLMSLRESVLEETCELIEAVDLEDHKHTLEELGDLLFNVIFFCKVAEKEGHFKIRDVVNDLVEKLVRRHPHVFGDKKIEGMDEFWNMWNSIKSQEQGKTKRESVLDGIPKGLPALARAQKMLKKINKTGYPGISDGDKEATFTNETELGKQLFDLVMQAERKGLDAEQALRKTLAEHEHAFRYWESDTKKV